ncbi:MAG: 50S ribosomal protein L5 [Candidatus Promineifilaceae bacterium]
MFKPLDARYTEDVRPALVKEFNYENPMMIPGITKVVVNVGVGESIVNAKAIDFTVRDITDITGQKPVVTRSSKDIATFKLRRDRPIGVKVTLRKRRMWDFLARLIHVALPRTRDFRGVSAEAFDGRGNYTLGLAEQLIFPEIDYDKIDKVRGLEVTIVTTANTDEEARKMLAELGMPFKRD